MENILRLPSKPAVRDILPAVCESIVKELPETRKIYLYGSQARGDWTEDSDIDLFVVIGETAPHEHSVSYRLTEAVCDATMACDGIFIPINSSKDLDEFTDEDFKEGMNPAFVINLRREGIVLYEIHDPGPACKAKGSSAAVRENRD